MRPALRRGPFVIGVLLAVTIVPALLAQDPFEIQVYEAATVPKGKWELETHVNYTSRGTKSFEGTVAPSQGQLHLAFEFTRGITDWFELAGYALFARRAGHSPDAVGYRIRPRVRAPDRWKLPVELGLSLEVGFPRNLYEEADATLEVRPVLERRFGRVGLALNPVFGRSIRGPGSGDGWTFEPGGRFGVTVSPKVDLSAEYYGGWGRVGHFPPSNQQVHQFFGGGDYCFKDSLELNVGLGFAATPAGDQTVWKMRLGWIF